MEPEGLYRFNLIHDCRQTDIGVSSNGNALEQAFRDLLDQWQGPVADQCLVLISSFRDSGRVAAIDRKVGACDEA